MHSIKSSNSINNSNGNTKNLKPWPNFDPNIFSQFYQSMSCACFWKNIDIDVKTWVFEKKSPVVNSKTFPAKSHIAFDFTTLHIIVRTSVLKNKLIKFEICIDSISVLNLKMSVGIAYRSVNFSGFTGCK